MSNANVTGQIPKPNGEPSLAQSPGASAISAATNPPTSATASPTVPVASDVVNLTIDGKAVSVKKGTNLIQAAKSAGIEIPFYCYHPHLSVVGNCRMCQVQIQMKPEAPVMMAIGCNTTVAEGMKVMTQNTSKDVADTQAATLEFILINHPLDCTVCDQAGQCKLQDYHYEYNARNSRFIENKEHKVKAQPLGPTVMLDGERCIMCTRCIRFCDEVTKTSELGMLNRGDRSVISVSENRPLDNPFSGTVVDLCPVGALTHKNWRFNTRIWFTKETETICPGCSTGCNVKVAVRDRKVTQVKARLNSEVNKEWLCDEGRYGFDRFLPEQRIVGGFVGGVAAPVDAALAKLSAFKGKTTLVLVSPDLHLEEYWLLKQFVSKALPTAELVLAYVGRELTELQKILISPDYASNFRGAEFAGVATGELETTYRSALQGVSDGAYNGVLFIGDKAIAAGSVTAQFLSGLSKAQVTGAILADAAHPIAKSVQAVVGGRSILEKSGILVNRSNRLQYAERSLDPLPGTESEWKVLTMLAEKMGSKLTKATNDRELTLEMLAAEARLAGLTIAKVKAGGIALA